MNSLVALVDRLGDGIKYHEMITPGISGTSVGWHVEHSLLVIDKTLQTISKSDPALYRPQFRISKLLVFTLNKIPRGRGKSPKIVLPGSFNAETLSSHLAATIGNLKNYPLPHPQQYFQHPYFGHLNYKSTLRFLKIHTRHHLKIIEDIIKAGETTIR